MIKAFMPCCAIEGSAAAQAAAALATLLNLRFTVPFWARLLTELTRTGVFQQPISSVPALHDRMALAQPDPLQLQLGAGDYALTPVWGPGAAGAGAVAVARRAALARVKFLARVTLADMAAQGSTAFPLGVLCSAVGVLGPCLDQAVRYDAAGHLAQVASFLRSKINKTNDMDLAYDTPEFFEQFSLPAGLRAHGVTARELLLELRAAIDYHGSASGRRNVEDRRINLLGPECVA